MCSQSRINCCHQAAGVLNKNISVANEFIMTNILNAFLSICIMLVSLPFSVFFYWMLECGATLEEWLMGRAVDLISG